jgi:hypothetical protein
MREELDRLRSADWRLRLYTLLVPVFWTLALGPGDGGAGGVELDWGGAALNSLLLALLWLGSRLAVTLLGLYAMLTTMIIGSIGFPPWGPTFGALALIAGAQFLLLITYDLDPENEKRGARTPAGPGAPDELIENLPR